MENKKLLLIIGCTLLLPLGSFLIVSLLGTALGLQGLRARAEKGDVEAMYRLGEEALYDHSNREKSVEWFQKAAEGGHRLAQYQVGMAFLNGKGIGRDELKARYWLTQAAKQGHEMAKGTLAHMGGALPDHIDPFAPEEEEGERVIIDLGGTR